MLSSGSTGWDFWEDSRGWKWQTRCRGDEVVTWEWRHFIRKGRASMPIQGVDWMDDSSGTYAIPAEACRKGTTPWGQRKKWSNKRSEAGKLTGDWWPPGHMRTDARVPRKCWQQLNWVWLQNPWGSGICGPWYLFNVVRIRMGLQKQEHRCMSAEEPADKISTPLSPTAGVCNPVPIWGLVSVRKR